MPGAKQDSWMSEAGQIPNLFPEENLHFSTNFALFPKKMFDSSPKTSHDLFKVIYQKMWQFIPKTFSIFQLRLSKFLTTFLKLFTMFVFTKLGRWMPPGWMPGGRRTVRTPSSRHCFPLLWPWCICASACNLVLNLLKRTAQKSEWLVVQTHWNSQSECFEQLAKESR